VVAIGAPLLVGWLVTLVWGDPFDLGESPVPLSAAAVLRRVERLVAVAVPSARDRAAARAADAMIESGPYRLPQPVVRRAARATSGWRC
jgi:hypothetical protein